MEGPFFMRRWNPVRRAYFTQPKRSPSKPKVVFIPSPSKPKASNDHSKKQAAAAAGSRKDHRLAAAMKIQKVFRGFLVRKSVRTVHRLASEAESIARRIEAEEVEIRRDAKERLRLGEMLMSLLLRLDSVRGIREYRKKVIRRVISLQEAMDSIREYSKKRAAAVKIQKGFRGFLVRKSVRTVRRLASEAESIARRIEAEEVEIRRDAKERLRLGEMLLSLLLQLDSVRGIREYRKKVIRRVISLQEAIDSIREYSKKRAAAVKIQKVFRGFLVRKSVRTVRRLASEAEEIGLRRIEGIRRDSKERLRVSQMLMSLLLRLDSVCGIREYRKKVIRRVISLQEAVDSISVSNGTPPDRSLEAPESIEKMLQNRNIYSVEDSETLGMKEVIKRVAADNERLKMLVAELCEGNAKQCRLMSRLVERVEQRMERKKNKRSQANSALASSIHKKCGGGKKQQ